jgi:hypothetical protein
MHKCAAGTPADQAESEASLQTEFYPSEVFNRLPSLQTDIENPFASAIPHFNQFAAKLV